jgi:LPS sulfotransferase NodH
MLCNLLGKTGVLGHPEEHFNFDYRPDAGENRGKLWGNGAVERWAATIPYAAWIDGGLGDGGQVPDPRAYAQHYARYLRLTATPNGITGAKVTWDHYYRLCAGLGERPHVDRWIWLRRRDKLRQAISSYKNHATLQAQLRPGMERKPDPPFDAEEILNWAMRYKAEDAIWEAEFSTLAEWQPVAWQVWYEDWTVAPSWTVGEIAVMMGAKAPDIELASDHLRMANETSEAWHQELLPTWERILAA